MSAEDATGRSLEEWFAVLDSAGAADWSHRDIVRWLEQHHGDVSGWWHQSITVEYERARGKRVLGQTADADFQLGVQRTAAAPAEAVWDALVSDPKAWLGVDGVVFEPGTPYAAGEVRVVKPKERIRMTWQPPGADWERPATLQVTLTPSPSASGKTAVGVHLERLPGPDARAAMKQHWTAVLEAFVAEIS